MQAGVLADAAVVYSSKGLFRRGSSNARPGFARPDPLRSAGLLNLALTYHWLTPDKAPTERRKSRVYCE
jgi:hypothetical protein